MIGEAISHGAVTIVNAIATGRGAAFGIDLYTRARVRLTAEPGIRVTMEDSTEDPGLVKICVEEVLSRFGVEGGAEVTTESNIPVSRGLKSSSAAANAVVLATLKALSKEIDILEAIRIGTRSAVKAGVSITGAFDDAVASMMGGVVLTDNIEERIIKRDRMPEDVKVLLHIPDFKIRKKDLPSENIRSIAGLIRMAFDMALKGEYFWAMSLNGFCYATALNVDRGVALEALRHGALAAGLTGTGPATAVVVKEDKLDDFLSSMEGWDLKPVNVYNGED